MVMPQLYSVVYNVSSAIKCSKYIIYNLPFEKDFKWKMQIRNFALKLFNGKNRQRNEDIHWELFWKAVLWHKGVRRNTYIPVK